MSKADNPEASYFEEVVVFPAKYDDKMHYTLITRTQAEEEVTGYIIDTDSRKDANIIAKAINDYINTLEEVDFELEDAMVIKLRDKYNVTRISGTTRLARYAKEDTANKLADGINTYIKHLQAISGVSRKELKYRMGYEYYKKKNKELEWDLNSAKQFEYDYRGCCCGGDD